MLETASSPQPSPPEDPEEERDKTASADTDRILTNHKSP